MNKTVVKNILIAVFVPSVLSVAYFGYKFYTRRQKTKKLLDEVAKHFDSKDNSLSGMKEQVIAEWKKSLSSLKEIDFNSFFDYFMITIPNGKTTVNGKIVWVFENTNPKEYDIFMKKAVKAISGKDLEKMFNSLVVETK